MLTFFSQSGGTLFVSAILLGIVVLIVRHLYKRKKRGQCVSCDCCDHKQHCSGSREPK